MNGKIMTYVVLFFLGISLTSIYFYFFSNRFISFDGALRTIRFNNLSDESFGFVNLKQGENIFDVKLHKGNIHIFVEKDSEKIFDEYLLKSKKITFNVSQSSEYKIVISGMRACGSISY